MAWNDYANRIPANRAANGPCRNYFATVLLGYGTGQVSIGCRSPERDPQHGLNDILAERSHALNAQWRREVWRFAPEVGVKPTPRFSKYWRVTQLRLAREASEIARVHEQQTCQRLAVPAHFKVFKTIRCPVYPTVSLHFLQPCAISRAALPLSLPCHPDARRDAAPPKPILMRRLRPAQSLNRPAATGNAKWVNRLAVQEPSACCTRTTGQGRSVSGAQRRP